MDKGQVEFARQELRRKQSEIWDPYDEHLTPELIHFTSPQGFFGVIEKRQLWCTDVGFVNDDREGDHGLSVVKLVLNRKSVYRPFKEFIGSLDSLFGMKKQWTGYIFCFCSAGEQAYMWQDYAEGGTGCALVFHYDALFSGTNGGNSYALFRMLYDQEAQTHQVEQTLDHAIQLGREMDISGRESRSSYWNEVMFSLLTCAVRFKDPIWRHEQEVRLWVAGGSQVTPFEAFGKPRVIVEFEASSLKRVIKGHAAGEELSTEKITDLLRHHSFEMVPVVKRLRSGSPLPTLLPSSKMLTQRQPLMLVTRTYSLAVDLTWCTK